jgi:hypothetical protein
MADLIPGFNLPTIDFSGTFVLIILTFGIACVAALYVYSSRYPQRKFLVDENGIFKWITYRLDGNMVLDDNLLAILFRKQKLKEDITTFPRRFFQGLGNVYMANMTNGVLTPMTVSYDRLTPTAYNERGEITDVKRMPTINPTEIWDGKQVAMRFIENEEFASTQTKKLEPITASLLMSLPIVIILLVVIGGSYLMFDQTMKMATTIAAIQHENAVLVSQNIDLLLNVTRTGGNPAVLTGGS